MPARMLRLRCPHCGLRALSAWRKWALGWDRPVPCQACGLPVLVSGWFVVRATLPLVAGSLALAVVAGLRGGMSARTIMAWLIALGLCSALAFLFAVPLRRAGRSDAAAVQRARARAAGVPAP